MRRIPTGLRTTILLFALGLGLASARPTAASGDLPDVAAAPASARRAGATPPAAMAGEAALREQIVRYVTERAPSVPTEVVVPPLADFALAWQAPGDVQVVLSTAEQRFVGSVPLTLAIHRDGEVVKRGVVTLRVRVDRPVFLAARPLDRGALVHESDLRRELRDLATLPPGAVLEPEAIVGMRTRRALPAGVVFQDHHLRASQLVTRGQHVRLLFTLGALRIEGTGKARQDGRPGDLIRVMNLDSRREVMGVVTAEGEVDVAL